MDKLQEYKCLYEHEIDYSNQKNNRITVYLTLLTLLGTGDVYLFKSLFPIHVCWWWIIYLTLIVIVSVCLIGAIKAFYTAFMNYSYSYVNMYGIDRSCTQFNKQLKDQNIPEETINEIINQTLYDMLSEMYLNCALQNQVTNIKKQKNHEKFMNTYIISIVLLMVAYVYNIIINGLTNN